MSVIGDVLNQLGQDIIPNVAAIVFPDLMDITGETTAKDSIGADSGKTVTTPYSNVPVTWEKSDNGRRVVVGDKAVAYGNYKLTFPVYQNGTRINLTAGNKLKVLERGLEPEKFFSIVEIFDNQGVTWEVEARKES
jgi:hypothetical protein